MDHKQAVMARAREVFAGRTDQVLQVVKQDADLLRDRIEPAHFRGVLRRRFWEDPGAEELATAVAVAEAPFGEVETEEPQQCEELSQILRAGATALEKLLKQQDIPDSEWTKDEVVGLECCLLLYGRPALLLSDGRLGTLPAVWEGFEREREGIELAQYGVGRIELLGHPLYDWAGTGFLVGETVLMTTRQVAEVFIERHSDGRWSFRPGVSAWLDNRSHSLHPISASCRIESVIGVDDHYDLALLRVERPLATGRAPVPLTIAAHAPRQLAGHAIYMVGYPVRDSRQTEPSLIGRIFREVYDVKRVHPGCIREEFEFRDVHLFRHDCGMLGNTRGACLLDLETHEVLGLQVSGRYLEAGTAIPLWRLRDCPLLHQAGVLFGEATPQEVDGMRAAVSEIAGTPYWGRLRTAVNAILYQMCREGGQGLS
jgi:hypothetical protein